MAHGWGEMQLIAHRPEVTEYEHGRRGCRLLKTGRDALDYSRHVLSSELKHNLLYRTCTSPHLE